MYIVLKINKKWVLFNSKNGMILTKFKGVATKKEAEKMCKLYNKVA